MHEQRVLADEAGVERFRAEATPITAEEKSAADHIDGADYDGWASWIATPFCIVRALSSQSADRQRCLARTWRNGTEFREGVSQTTWFGQNLANLFGFVGCLI